MHGLYTYYETPTCPMVITFDIKTVFSYVIRKHTPIYKKKNQQKQKQTKKKTRKKTPSPKQSSLTKIKGGMKKGLKKKETLCDISKTSPPINIFFVASDSATMVWG